MNVCSIEDGELAFDSPGPLPTFREGSDKYLLATAHKELQRTDKFGKPVECFRYNPIFPGAASHHDYLRFSANLAVAPCLLLKDPGNVSNRSALRHPDISACVS